MSALDIVRAWKDAEYRQSLSAEEQALLPEHPAGAIELTDEELLQAAAAGTGELCTNSLVVCTTFDFWCPPQTLTA